MLQEKVEARIKRFESVEADLTVCDITKEPKRYKALAQEHSYLLNVKNAWEKKLVLEQQLQDNEAMLKSEKDPDFIAVLQEDITRLQKQFEEVMKRLEDLVIPPGPYDSCNTILELRAGTGGDEAGLFVGDCVRMYTMYAAKMGWKCEPLFGTESEKGGFKEYAMVLSGPNVYRLMQYEGGIHRVQRVPETEAQGRIHTSTITVAALVEPDEDEDVELNEADIRMEATRSSGAGGQHVNKTDSAVRLTHIPTGIVVFCQEERSQHKNRDKGMRILRARIAEVERKKKKDAIDSKRLEQVGSGDRSEKIRTYNFPQNRLTDHRINVTKYNLDQIMNGDLEDISLALVLHFQQLES